MDGWPSRVDEVHVCMCGWVGRRGYVRLGACGLVKWVYYVCACVRVEGFGCVLGCRVTAQVNDSFTEFVSLNTFIIEIYISNFSIAPELFSLKWKSLDRQPYFYGWATRALTHAGIHQYNTQ